MLKILVTSSKGGCGKSTISTHLAARFALDGKNTVLLDADPQGSSLSWCARRPLHLPGILGIKSPRKNWASSLPKDTQRVVIDTAAGTTADELECYLDEIDALVVPILPSVFDLESTSAFLASVAKLPKIKRGKVAVGLIANRLKPWTHQSSESIREISQWPFPLIAQLRDTTGYVVLTGLGKSIFDFNSEQVRNHQEDWMPLLRWLKKTK